MVTYITSMQRVTQDGYYLATSDGDYYYVSTSANADGDYFADNINHNENLNTVSFNNLIFAGNDILSLKLHYECGLLNDSLAIDTLTAELASTAALTVSRQTAITVKRGTSIVGVFYNGQIKATGVNTYSLYAESPIALLDYDYHVGGIYRGKTMGSLIAELMGSVPYTINADVAAIKLYGYLPYATKRENLQQVLIATGAAIRKGADGKPDVSILTNTVVGTIDASRIFEGGSKNADTKITALQVTEHNYMETSEELELLNESFTDVRTVTFSEPAHSLSCTNGTIQASSANYAKIKGNGQVLLTGKKYIHTTKIITKGTITGNPSDKIYSVTDATLINPMNSAAAAERLYNYALCNETVTQDILTTTERPGDIVKVTDPHGTGLVTAAIQALDYTLSSTMRAAATFLVGYTPTGISSGYKNRKIFTSTGSFVIPAGIATMRVVLIGGGSGGTGGGKGETGSTGDVISGGVTVGVGGAGGSGGSGGTGGKVYDTTLSVTPGVSYTITIGTGGAGGAINGGAGAAGGNTLFGSVSSALGTAGATYIDAVTGDRYGITGGAGINGGSGLRGNPNTLVYNGITYVAGDRGRKASGTDESGGYCIAIGGGGGGPAVAANGGNGSNAHLSLSYNKGGQGGAGASATIAGTAATTPGAGGNGGHGGGGGGGGGEVNNRSTSMACYGGDGGPGGNGSKGGTGAAGCVIIYY